MNNQFDDDYIGYDDHDGEDSWLLLLAFLVSACVMVGFIAGLYANPWFVVRAMAYTAMTLSVLFIAALLAAVIHRLRI